MERYKRFSFEIDDLKKIYDDAMAQSLCTQEKILYDKIENGLDRFLEIYGDKLKEINIFHKNNPWRFSPAYPGEKPLKKQFWPLKKILPIVSVTPKKGIFLLLVCSRLRPGRVLEIGSAYGVSALYMLAGLNPNGESILTCIEKSNYYCKFIPCLLDSFTNWNIIQSDALIKTAEEEFQLGLKWDVIFVDALHQKEFNIRLFDNLIKIISPGGLIIFDDIRWTSQMWDMWSEITQRPEVSYSFDRKPLGSMCLKYIPVF